MMWPRSLGALVLLATAVHAAPATTETYSHSATLKSGEFIIYWKATTTDITFEIHAKTDGWVGLGVSANANMIAADITVGWIKGGVAKITDRHGDASSNAFPPLDSQQDVNLLVGQECDGWTLIKFSRQLGACEASTDREITSSTTRVIWAFGTSDPTGDDIVAANVHETANRGSMSLYLLETKAANRGELPTGNGQTYETFDAVVSNFEVPSQTTYYNCRLMKLPVDTTAKRHIVQIDPIVSAGNERYVHHILLYACGQTVPDEAEVGVDAPCFVSNMAYYSSCVTVLTAWAIGGSGFRYADVAGLPIGGDSPNAIYVQLETHYDNPNGLTNIVDSSGLRLTHTSSLLPYDLGLWQIGSLTHGPINFIPPHASAFLHIGYCAGACLSSAMSEASVSEVTVVGGILHSHLAGVAMKLRIIRAGVEQETRLYDDSYDFDYQEVRLFDPVLTLQSGDQLQMECTYDTEDRTEMVEAGLATDNEMCLVFLVYYPRLSMSKCETSPVPAQSYAHFGIAAFNADGASTLEQVIITSPPALAGQTARAVMDNYAWSNDKANEFSIALQGAMQYQECQKEGGTKTTEIFAPPTINTPYVIQPKTCTAPTTAYVQTLTEDKCPTTTTPIVTTIKTTTKSSAVTVTSGYMGIMLAVVIAFDVFGVIKME